MTCADLTAGLRRAILLSMLLLAACGGGGSGGTTSTGGTGSGNATLGGGGGSTGTTTPPATSVVNFTGVTVDNGPPALGTGSDASRTVDEAFVSVTLCAPGTNNCQTIDHVLIDTGSVGLRIVSSVLTPSLLAALPVETDTQGNSVGECYGYVDGYVFGSVRQADFTIGGESVAAMPFQAIGEGGAFATVPSGCSSGGGSNISTVKALAANGVLGIGVTATDCGQFCTVAGGQAAAIYYDCPAAGCGAVIARASSTTAPFQQVPNPVAAFATDNNGSILTLPALPSNGSSGVSGTLTFGIGTQSNNALGAATVLTTTTSASRSGVGLVTTMYNGRTLTDSFVDSGSNAYYFADSGIAACSASNETGYYCPASPSALAPTIIGANATRYAAGFTLFNADTLFNSGNAALPGLGANPGNISGLKDISNSFDYGLPAFFGHSVYTAIEGRTAGTATGPYIAFL